VQYTQVQWQSRSKSNSVAVRPLLSVAHQTEKTTTPDN